MSNSGKRPFLLEGEERVAKKAKGFHHTENGSSNEAVFDRSSDQPYASSTSYIDLTQNEPMDGDLDLVNGQDETLPRKANITANSGAMKSDAATRGSEWSGSAAQTTVTSAAIRSRDATSVAAYDVCFGLVIY